MRVPGGRATTWPARSGVSSTVRPRCAGPQLERRRAVEDDEDLLLRRVAVRDAAAVARQRASPSAARRGSTARASRAARSSTGHARLSSSTSSTLTMFAGRGAGSPTASGSTVASTSHGSSSRPSTHGQPSRIARERGSQPSSVGWRVPKTMYSSPQARRRTCAPSRPGAWMTQSSGRTSCTSPSCHARPEPARTKKSSSDAPCECGGVGSLPGSTRTRLTPTPRVPGRVAERLPRRRPSRPSRARRRSTSSQCATPIGAQFRLAAWLAPHRRRLDQPRPRRRGGAAAAPGRDRERRALLPRARRQGREPGGRRRAARGRGRAGRLRRARRDRGRGARGASGGGCGGAVDRQGRSDRRSR